MSKKKILIPLIIFSTVLSTCTVYIYQMLYSPNFLINSKEKFIIINEKTEFNELINSLERDTIINDILSFSVLSKIMEYQENIKEGAYKVKTNMSNYDMITMLRSGNQTPINITFSYARNPVVPDCKLELKIEAIRSHGRVWKYKGEAFVGEKKMADAQWSATIVDRK